MFYKFQVACSTVYGTLLCAKTKALPVACAIPRTCANGGAECASEYWSVGGSAAASELRAARPYTDTLPVACCGASEAGVTSCTATGLGGLGVVGNDRGCSNALTWPDADRFCMQAGLRLCTLNELEGGACASAGCGYDAVRVWAKELPPSPPPPSPPPPSPPTPSPPPSPPPPSPPPQSFSQELMSFIFDTIVYLCN